jgi:hypothetical protein
VIDYVCMWYVSGRFGALKSDSIHHCMYVVWVSFVALSTILLDFRYFPNYLVLFIFISLHIVLLDFKSGPYFDICGRMYMYHMKRILPKVKLLFSIKSLYLKETQSLVSFSFIQINSIFSSNCIIVEYEFKWVDSDLRINSRTRWFKNNASITFNVLTFYWYKLILIWVNGQVMLSNSIFNNVSVIS